MVQGRIIDLRYWNNIYRNTIRVGQKLVIYVDPSKSEYYSKINTMSFAEKQAYGWENSYCQYTAVIPATGTW